METKFIPISRPSITEKEISMVSDAVRSTWISSLGKYIDEFEEKFASFCGAKHALTVMNGTVAIQLALVAYGIKEGDEVIVPDLSFIATANAVLYVGAKPVFVDVESETFCLDPEKFEQAITSRTRAVIPVHLYGHPADMEAINRIAAKHGIIVIEDAAEAHGASVHGQKVGSIGHCATFSFYGNKNFTTGEGGMVVTNDEHIYNRCRYLRDHAMSKEKRYWHTEMGFNFRMTNLQAALGCAQLERADEIMQNRNHIFREYNDALKGFDRIHLNKTKAWATNSFWLISARMPGISEEARDQLIIDLKSNGVDSRPFFYPMSMMPYINAKVNNPVTYQVSSEGINLPTFFELTREEIRYICSTLKRLLAD